MEKNSDSPFHAGEIAVQTRLGVREPVNRVGSLAIRDYLPNSHRSFFEQLSMVFVGHADKEGWPWASILFNDSGFISSSDAKTLEINAMPIKGDPLSDALKENLALGLLGIELTTRRRNRLSAHVTNAADGKICLSVDQAFGNCPKYIQVRELENINADELIAPTVDKLSTLDQRAIELIQNSDTFFVASYTNTQKGEDVDVSHRGGRPGFIRVDDQKTLTIPEYVGNFFFNTLGNFVETAKAGLLFVDFEKGHLLTLTGRVEIIWESAEMKYFKGAERLWKFHVDHGYRINHGLPFHWKLKEYSPRSLKTGTWDEMEILRKAAENESN